MDSTRCALSKVAKSVSMRCPTHSCAALTLGCWMKNLRGYRSKITGEQEEEPQNKAHAEGRRSRIYRPRRA